MSVNLTINGTTYAYPSDGDPEGWGTTATSWAQAVTAGMLQKSAGLFTLTAELDFGSGYGIKSLYFKGRNSNPASAGQIRLSNTDTIKWRNAANSSDVALSVSASDKLTLDGVNLQPLTTAGDMAYFNSGDLQRLPIGSASQILAVGSGGIPEWISSSAVPMPWTTSGDTLYYTTSPQRLAIGAPGSTLTVSGSNLPSWVAETLTTNGDLLYYNSGKQRLAVGSEGQYLKVSSGLPSWQTQAPDKDPEDLRIGLTFDCEDGVNQARAFAKLLNQGVILNAGSNMAAASFAQTDLDSTNKKFGTYSFDCTGNGFGFSGEVASPNKSSVLAWYRNLTAGDYIAYNPLLGAELYLDASGYQTFKITESTAAGSETAKDSTTVQGSVDRSADATFRCATAKWRVNEVGGASTDLMEMERDAVDEGTQIGSDTINVNGGAGGHWFFGCKPASPSWQQFCSFKVLPSAMASDAWTYSGTSTEGNVFSVSNGILNFSPESSNTSKYLKTSATLSGINLLNMNVVFKVRVNSCYSSRYLSQYNSVAQMQIIDDSVNRSLLVDLADKGFTIMGYGATGNAVIGRYFIDMSQWHQIWIKCSDYSFSPGNPQYDIYVDGVHVGTGVNGNTATDVNDVIQLAGSGGAAGATADIDFEYFAYGGTATSPVSGFNTSGNLDSVGLVKRILTDDEITDLQTTDVCSYFKTHPNYGPYIPIPMQNCAYHSANPTFTGNSWQQLFWNQIYVAGDGVTEFDCSGYASATNSGNNGYVAIDIDNTLAGLVTDATSISSLGSIINFQSGAAATSGTTCVKTVLKPGLRKVSMVGATQAIGATITLQQNSPFLTVKRSDSKKIY